MLQHIGLQTSSKENARSVFNGIFGMKEVRTFSINRDINKAFFGKDVPCDILVFRGENIDAEVFINESAISSSNDRYDHICMLVSDLNDTIARCKKSALEIIQHATPDKTITFMKDKDGNLYELKERPKQ
jgi:catechol 2,3-dioxygenase-like lactoylglutathione lyase family enzyme